MVIRRLVVSDLSLCVSVHGDVLPNPYGDLREHFRLIGKWVFFFLNEYRFDAAAIRVMCSNLKHPGMFLFMFSQPPSPNPGKVLPGPVGLSRGHFQGAEKACSGPERVTRVS